MNPSTDSTRRFADKLHSILSLGGLSPLYAAIGSVLIYAAVSHLLGSLDHAAMVTRQDLRWWRSNTFYTMTATVLVIALTWNLVFTLSIITDRLKHLRLSIRRAIWTLGVVLFFAVLCAGYSGLCPNLAGNFNVQLLGWVDNGSTLGPVHRLTDAMNMLGIFDILLIVATLHTLVTSVDFEQRGSIARSVKDFVYLVYSGSALLTAGVVEVYALYNWAANAGPYLKAAHQYAIVMAFYFGGLFSVLMVIMYLPIAVILNNTLTEMYFADQGNSRQVKMAAWLERMGLKAAPLSLSGSYVAIVIPVVTGALTKLLQL